jgi:hypothetical protein
VIGADVAQIFIKGNSAEINIYRPVSLTSAWCKIMEDIIRDNLVKYFEVNKVLSEIF